MKWSIVLQSILITAIFILGCSGGSNPVNPTGSNNLTGQSSEQPSGKALWGLWQCQMEPGSTEMQVVPLRTATFTANVNKILEGKPGNLQIKDMDFTEFFTTGRLDCTVELHHPFPGLGMYNGFDVWGVFMHNGAASLQYDGLTYADGNSDDEALLLNPDGYTRWFNATEFDGNGIPLIEYWPGKLGKIPLPTAMINPYKVFADGLDAYDDYHEWLQVSENTEDRGIFKAGNINSRRYELKFPMVGGAPVVDFQYAAVASWEPGDPALTGDVGTYDPFDFPTSANCEEPFFINVSTIASDLYFAAPDDFGGTFRADVEVFDWQGGSVGNTGVPNEIESIIFESDFINGGANKFSKADLAPIAQPATVNSSVFSVEIAGCSPQASGDTNFWVIVEAAGLNGASYGQGFPTKYPEDARRANFLPGIVSVGTEPSIPPNLDYNFIISTQRSASGLIQGIKLEWDEITNYPMCNIYKKSAYEPGAVWELMPASPVSAFEYIDTDFKTYEGYMYYLAATNGVTEFSSSQVAFILMEDAEETVNTFSVWEDDYYFMDPYYERWGPLGSGPHSPPPANGLYSWDESAIENFPTDPGDFWTGFWMLLCSPVLSVDSENTTVYVEFMSRTETYEILSWPDGYYAGGKVGVCSAVDRNQFYPSDDYREGFKYPIDDVGGLWRWGQFPNCAQPEPGYAGNYSYWQFTSYYVNDVLTTTDPRVGFAFGACNCALGYGWNVDDIAIIIY